MDHYKSAGDVADKLRPDAPVTCLRPHAATQAARWFCGNFDGRVLYAVKANPARELLEALWTGGVRDFDVASLGEVRHVRAHLPEARLALMHPVKSPETIAEAYFEHGVRVFALDSVEELEKIRCVTKGAEDLTLCVRLSVANSFAKLSLGSKFGAHANEAPALLMRARQYAEKLGLCFHVGSQAMSPTAFTAALETARKVIAKAGVLLDVLDVGGGFPAIYPGMVPPPIEDYVREIMAAVETMPITETCEIWCEPGRGLVAEATSVLVRVEARKDDRLYINDGTYGSLFDAGALGWVYPARLLRQYASEELKGFSFYGPTCDDLDFMAGPFHLPADIAPGDYIEISMLGAYGAAMRTGFNGFLADQTVIVEDAPHVSAYRGEAPAAGIAAQGEG